MTTLFNDLLKLVDLDHMERTDAKSVGLVRWIDPNGNMEDALAKAEVPPAERKEILTEIALALWKPPSPSSREENIL